jgi:dTDP-4-dehydrorhamnose reductase
MTHSPSGFPKAPVNHDPRSVLVIGAKGMLGSDLFEELERREFNVVGVDLPEFDITDPMTIARFGVGEFGSFGWIVNCAAYTAVDKAETETQAATEVNTLGPGYLAHGVQLLGAKLIHISTDFVFDGSATTPYKEDAPTNPLGVYGRTKRDGEEAVLSNNPNAIVVRTAWLYGPNGACFPRSMIRAFEAGKTLRVVADQTGCPTYTRDLARVLVDIIDKNAFPGIYHAVGPESMTWHEFTRRTLEAWERRTGDDRPIAVQPIKTEDWPTPATRPKYSVLSTAKLASLGIEAMSPPDEALADFCRRLPSS